MSPEDRWRANVAEKRECLQLLIILLLLLGKE